MSNWIRFHAELRQGDKRELPRATRFVYLELSLEARARRGVVVIPRRMGDVDAVHEVIGGNRKEVAEAVKELASGNDPMIAFEEREGKRVLVVLNWAKWNPKDGTGAERQKRWRNDRRNGSSDTPCDAVDNGSVTPAVTVAVTAVTEPRAHALLSLSSLSDSSLPESSSSKTSAQAREPEAGSAERYVATTDPITPELTATAQNATVQDISGAWLKFTGHYAGKWVHVQGQWQAWCVREAKRERVERDQARARRQNGPVDVADPYNDPKAVRERERAREAQHKALAAQAVAPPTGLAALVADATPGRRRPSRPPPKADGASEARIRQPLTEAESEAKRLEGLRALQAFETPSDQEKAG